MCHLRQFSGRNRRFLMLWQPCKRLPKRIFSGFITSINDMNPAHMIFAQAVSLPAKVITAKNRFSVRSRTGGNITANDFHCTDMDQLNHN